ncbi:mitochondrial cardiolipin hydrolase-like [Oppia nitens]|uniref:mitochondrial cardiolipin hydrolase-like n=1 Tax=Oppia nitens TaxID=1686743 RepID=UPI0023DB9D98|nr:mitochondrial cardiolipin hydrolase-like [Oppia nitens]
MNDLMRYGLYVSSVLVVTEILYQTRQYWRRRRQQQQPKDQKKSSPVVSMGLFFPDYSMCCPFVFREDYHTRAISFSPPEQLCSRPESCQFTHFSSDPKKPSPLKRLIKVLTSANKSLSVCQWVFSIQVLANVCLELHRKGIVVRIVIDSREDETDKSQIDYMKTRGIAIRYGPRLINSAMFHHKFAIVDDTILMTGSMNWTVSAVRKSYENVCVTSKPSLVGPYVRRFEDYWTTFSAEPTNVKRSDLLAKLNSK